MTMPSPRPLHAVATAVALAIAIHLGAAQHARAAAPAAASKGGASAGQTARPAAGLTLEWTWTPAISPTPQIATVEVRGLDAAVLQALRRSAWTAAQWQELLPVYATDQNLDLAAAASLPPMLGSYAVDGSILRFTPRFPLQLGVHYRAVLHPARLPRPSPRTSDRPDLAPRSAEFHLPAPDRRPVTDVAAVSPAASVLPENLLKFYLHFSGPMSRGRSYEHLRLVDDAGRTVDLPFLELDEELWDPAMTRLTLLLDPGRIKRGVTPLEEVGSALREGHSYTLVIDATWPDAQGRPLRAAHRKTFRVGPPVRSPIDPARWQITPPAAGSTGTLVVRFERPMDAALARRVLHVETPAGAVADGTVQLAEDDRQWRFTPARPWSRGSHELRVEPILEDLAGNNIGRSFDVDLMEGPARRGTNSPTRLAFEVP